MYRTSIIIGLVVLFSIALNLLLLIPEVSAQPDDCNGRFIPVNCGTCLGCGGYAVADCPAGYEKGIPGDRIVQCVDCTQNTQHDCSTSPEGCRNNPIKGCFRRVATAQA